MKTLLTLLTAILLLSSAPAMAVTPTTNHSSSYAEDARGVRFQLNRLLTFASDKISGLEGEVNFVVRLRESGRIEILDITGDVEDVVDRVEKVLEHSRLLIAPDLVGKSFRVGINYNS